MKRRKNSKKKIDSGIYKLIIKTEDEDYFYYGQSLYLQARCNNHKSELINDKHENEYIQHVFDKYKNVHFEIIERLPPELLDEWEQMYLDEYFGTSHCMNLCPKAGSCKGIKRDAAWIERQGRDRKGTKMGGQNRHSKKVKLVIRGEEKIFSCLREAAEFINVSYVVLSRWLLGKHKWPSPGDRRKQFSNIQDLFETRGHYLEKSN